MVLCAVYAGERAVGERAHRLGAGPHVHQHPAHVWMVDNRGRFGAAYRRPLHPLPGVAGCLLVGGFGHGHALQPNIQPRVVHHGEHVFEAAVGLTDEIGDRAFLVAVRHDGGR
jgi:hypothetical protein